MATNQSVTVLTPNGRRQNVKVTPNTTILQILEEVCHKQGFNPEEFDLKHHNKVMDTTVSFRFSGLPNNASLEMASILKKRTDSQVFLGVQLENGERLTGSFSPSSTLWSVLSSLCPSEIDPETNPIVIYMRREVHGENALKEINLKSLGLTGGRAMLRLIHREPSSLKTQANVSTPLPSKVYEEKPYKRILQENVKTCNIEKGAKELMTDTEMNYSKVKQTAVENMNLLSGTIEQEKSKNNNIELDSMIIDTESKQTESNKTVMDVDLNPSFDSSSQETDKNMSVQSDQEEEIAFLGERNAIAFSLSMSTTLPHEDLPDEFFDLTVNDARTLLRDLQRLRKEIDEAPLQTSTLRNLEYDKKVMRNLNQYKRSVLRVQFPDRTVLQGTFRPLETISTVMEFVKDYLKDNNLEFQLFLTPPKKVLKPETHLVDAECVPRAVVHFGAMVQLPENYQFLKDDIMSKICSINQAKKAASKSFCFTKNTEKSCNQFNDNLSQPSTSKEMETSQNCAIESTSKLSSDKSGNGKVPKWFKSTTK